MNGQLALAMRLNNGAALADFCWGSNLFLQQQLTRSLQDEGERFFTIWGNSGCGKSHLLQGCCQAVIAKGASAIYLPLEILKEWGPESIDGIERQALIAIDDIDCIATDAAWEESLFYLYNRVRASNGTILLISAKHPPPALSIRLADLCSRLSWGLVVQLYELDDTMKIHTLQQYALKRGFRLSIAVGQFLINRCARSMHDLLEILNRLDEASLIAQRKITVPFVKRVLGI